MAVEKSPWAVHGTKHSAAVARTALYASTSGAHGVGGPGDLRVTATPTPSNQVAVAPGAALLLAGDPSAQQQSYTMRNVTETLVEIPASGSSGANTWWVVARVTDPQFEGDQPADPLDHYYSSIEVLSSIPLTATVEPLAKVEVPANTSTITQGMITDVRQIAMPREKSFIYPLPTVVATEEVLTSTQEKGELFPDVGSITAPIPEWATRVQIVAEWLQVAQPAGDFNGRIWVEWGPYVERSVRRHRTQTFGVNGNNSNNVDRAYWKVAQEMYISPDLRGTNQIFFMKGRLLSRSGASSRPRLDSISGIILSLRFLQVPDDLVANQ